MYYTFSSKLSWILSYYLVSFLMIEKVKAKVLILHQYLYQKIIESYSLCLTTSHTNLTKSLLESLFGSTNTLLWSILRQLFLIARCCHLIWLTSVRKHTVKEKSLATVELMACKLLLCFLYLVEKTDYIWRKVVNDCWKEKGKINSDCLQRGK